MDDAFEDWLLAIGFRKISTIVEYTERLENENELEGNLLFHSLAEGLMTDEEFAKVYELC